MNVNLDLYSYFYFVCEFKSITKAANYLYISQPAITKQLKKLEKQLGKELFVRNNKGIELTENGKLLYNEIKSSIEKLNSTEATFKDKTNKYNETIRIVAGHSTLKHFIIKSMLEYNKIHPSIKFEVMTFKYHESIQLLREGKVDLIFLSTDEMFESYNNVTFEKFMDVNDIFVVSKDIKDNYPNKIKLLDLNKYSTISLQNNAISRKWLNDYFKDNNSEYKPKYELSNAWLVEEYALLDAGIGLVVKEHVIDELKNGKLIEIETDKKIPKRTMLCAYKTDSIKYNLVREIFEYIKKNVNE